MPQPQPTPILDLPVAVWEDHLLPMLRSRNAARLGSTCKALREVVREHFRDLGSIRFGRLRAALTTFPRAQSMATDPDRREHLDEAQIQSLVAWLTEGGHGRGITTMTTTAHCNGANELIHAALRRGALPSLKGVAADLMSANQDLLTGGFLGPMHELRVKADCSYGEGEQLELLAMVRQLPALAKLEVEMCNEHGDEDDVVLGYPFIPPSLTALRINLEPLHRDPSITYFFLRDLPDMLGASGARLERLELEMPRRFDCLADVLVHVAQAVRCCSPTLKDFRLSVRNEIPTRRDAHHARLWADQEQRLRVHWAELLAGVSACRELQVLVLPRSIKVEPLFPPGTAFARLTHLEMGDYEREHPPPAGEMGLWELMASGGLPALAKLRVGMAPRRERAGVEEVKTRVAPALEAVAGTLTQLDLWSPAGGSDEVDVGYEVGVAVGRLRRLKDLALMLGEDSRPYHAFAQGLAASGGDHPLPLLWRVDVSTRVSFDADLLASLLLPSVRVFSSCHTDARSALLVACALRRAGYKHTWAPCVRRPPGDGRDLVRGIAQCSFGHHRTCTTMIAIRKGVVANGTEVDS
jgi:hypothetical protein